MIPDFTKCKLVSGDRTILNNGLYVQIIEVFPTYLDCAILDPKTEDIISEDIKTVTFKDFSSSVRYKGLKKYSDSSVT